jgi:hypothetical protein
LLLLAALCSLPVVAEESSSGASNEIAWMMQYAGKSSNDLVSDPRFAPTLQEWLPSQPPLPLMHNTVEAAQNFMGQGQGKIQVNGQYLLSTGCLPHACNVAGGWLWVDENPQQPTMVLALLDPKSGPPSNTLRFTLVVIGSTLTPTLDLPQLAREGLRTWLQWMKATNIIDFEIETKAGKQETALPAYLHVN